MIHPASQSADELLGVCDVHRTRRSGPGGQHRNKVETAIVLTHRPTGLRAEASERRSQVQNQREALRRLRMRLAIEFRTQRDAVSDLWRARCKGGRVTISEAHDDFPAVLAEALDTIAQHEDDVKAAGEVLGCTASQLIKLLKQAPAALDRVNRARVARDLRPLR